MRAKRSSPKTNERSTPKGLASSGNGKPTNKHAPSSRQASANGHDPTRSGPTPKGCTSDRDLSSSRAPNDATSAQQSSTSGSSAPTTRAAQSKVASSEPSLHLSQLIDQHDTDASASHATVAQLVIQDLAKRPDGWELVTPAVNAYVNSRRRFPARKRERQIIPLYTPGDGTVEARSYVRELSLAQLAEFADETINFQCQRIRAGAMTTTQWEEKIEELERVITERQDTVSRYELIRRTLDARGVETIDAALSQGRN